MRPIQEVEEFYKREGFFLTVHVEWLLKHAKRLEKRLAAPKKRKARR